MVLSRAPHPYADFVHAVEKPARYLGGEYGAAVKDWSAVDAKVCLAFPDVYDIGMSHLGFKILYKILNDHPRTLAERCYMPWVDMIGELRSRELPLVSLESARPLRDFDVVGFSLQFELTYTNVLEMLDLGGIPVRSDARSEDDPLVIAGGPTATHPEPIALFVDAFVIGDGEERATDVSLLWTELRAKGVPRAERLRELSRLPGVYVPSLYETRIDAETGFEVVVPGPSDAPFPVKRSLIDDLDRFPFPAEGPVGGPEAIFDRMSIEIARGCTEGCRFCQAGMIYRPVRERDPSKVVDTIMRAVESSGYDEVSLTSLSTADYSCVAPLVEKVTERLAPQKVSLGVSSLRAYGLSESVLDDMRSVRASGLTFAPEAGSQRMRDVVNKNVTEEQLMDTAERVFERGWDGMKLYFMIGLPTEEEEDVREIVRVGARARLVGKKIRKERKAGPPKVTVSVSTHVPKPHTPFQWCAMDAGPIVREKQGWLAAEARGTGVDLRMHDSRTSWLEGVFARGDRKVARVLERAWRGGARFDSWQEHLRLGVWEQAFVDEGVDPAVYLGTLPVTARLPWDHIDVGLEEGFLLREYQKSLKSRLSPPCGKVAGAFVHATNLEDAEKETRRLVCYDCGVACDLSAMRAERHKFLEGLGAKRPRSLPVVAEAPAEVAPAPKRNVPPRLVQGEPRRYRFAFTKTGPTSMLSHLDLIRALPRSFRRLDVPIYYSSGFHPKPDMTFAPALSLGVASLAECVDVKLTVDVDAEELARALGERSAEGLDFPRGARLGDGDPTVAKAIDAAAYGVGIPAKMLESWGGVAALESAVAELLAKSEHRLMRRIDGVGKWVDVRKYLRQLRVGDATAAAWLDRAGYVGDLTPLFVDVDVTPGGAVKVSEVVRALAGILRGDDGAPVREELPFRAVRGALGLRDGEAIVSPLDVAEVRRVRAASAAAAAAAVAPAVPVHA